MQDTALFQGKRKLDYNTATDSEFLTATFGTLKFTTQKNSVRGEVVGAEPLLGASSICKEIMCRRLLHRWRIIIRTLTSAVLPQQRSLLPFKQQSPSWDWLRLLPEGVSASSL